MLAVWDVVMKTVCSGVSVGSCGFVLYGNGHVVSVGMKSMGRWAMVGRRWMRDNRPFGVRWRFETMATSSVTGGLSGGRLGVRRS